MRSWKYTPPRKVTDTTYWSPEHGEDRDGVIVEREGGLVYLDDDGEPCVRSWGDIQFLMNQKR